MPDEKKSPSLVSQLAVPLILALVVGGSAPWWWKELFKDKTKEGTQQEGASRASTPSPPPAWSTESPTQTAVLPEVVDAPIWDAVPLLRSAGFNTIEVDLRRNENHLFQNRVAPGNFVTEVSRENGEALQAHQTYSAQTPVRIQVQLVPEWNLPAKLYQGSEAVDGIVELLRHKETESEQVHKGAGYLNR